MGFPVWPYTNFHDLNADWILAQIKQFGETYNNLPTYIKNEISNQLSQLGINFDIIINVKQPPEDLKPCVGDGTTDDTENLQAIINYCNNKTKLLLFPDGLYILDTINILSNVSLIGIDKTKCVLRSKALANKTMISGNMSSGSISNLTIDGNFASQTSTDFYLVDITINNCYYNNIILDNVYEGIKISGNNNYLENISFKNTFNNGLYVVNDLNFINNLYSFDNTSDILIVDGKNNYITARLNNTIDFAHISESTKYEIYCGGMKYMSYNNIAFNQPPGVVGDGVTDCTALLETAVENNDIVYLYPGVYYVTKYVKTSNIISTGKLKLFGIEIPLARSIETPITFDMSKFTFENIDNYLSVRKVNADIVFNFPEGTYNYARSISYDREDSYHMSYIGAGSDKTKLVFDGTGKEGQGFGAFYYSNGHSVQLINGITIDGNNYSGYTGGTPSTAPGSPQDPQAFMSLKNAIINIGSDVIVQYFARCGIIAFSGGVIYCSGAISQYNGSDGIVSSSGSAVVAENCTSQYNYGYGMYVDYGGAMWASNSTVQNNQLHNGRVGIGAGANYGATLYANNLISKNNAAAGLCVIDGSFFGVGCEISNNGSYGVRVEDGGCCYIQNSNISNNQNNGLNIIRGSYCNASSCVITGNKNIGVNCIDSSTVFLNAAEISSSTDSGLQVNFNSYAYINGAKINNNQNNGVETSSGTVVGLAPAEIKNNGGFGVLARFGGIVNLSTMQQSNVSGNTSGSFSPAANTTTGIDQSYIYIETE